MQKFDATHYSGILLACMPKSGSSSTADMIAKFPRVRISHLVPGWDIREQEIDMEVLRKNLGLNVTSTFVAQTHVCLSNTTRGLIDRKVLLPILTTRNIPDLVASNIDHVAAVDQNAENFLMPRNFSDFPIEKKCDYIIHFHVPWLLKFFKSWARYDKFSDIWLRYEEMAASNSKYLEKIASILKLDVETNPLYSADTPDAVIATKRFNKGVVGRGRELLSGRQIELVEKMIDLYDMPDQYREYLMTGKY